MGWHEPVEGAGAVEEFEVEGGGFLAVDFTPGAGLHGHAGIETAEYLGCVCCAAVSCFEFGSSLLSLSSERLAGN